MRKATVPTPSPEPAPVVTTPIPAPAVHPEEPPAILESKSSVKAAIDGIDSIRENLKTVVRQFGDVLVALRQAEKEKKLNDREVEAVREKLRGIQNVRI